MEISETLQNLLFAEDWFIWLRDGDRVRRYTTEVWPDWLDVMTVAEMYEGDGPHVLVMLPYCKDHGFTIETYDDGSPITVEDFLAGEFRSPAQRAAEVPPQTEKDFLIAGHGSIFLLTPLTDAANAWVKEHIPDDAQCLGRAIAVEHRFIADIVEGITGDGLQVGE